MFCGRLAFELICVFGFVIRRGLVLNPFFTQERQG
jgi:hypothetical protein